MKGKEEIKIGNTIVFDIETTVLNKYTDNRISEVYSVAYRFIDEEKLQEAIKQGVTDENINNGEYLKSFLSEPFFFRTIEEFINFLKVYSKEQIVSVFAHNLDFELSYILRSTLANSVKNKNKLDYFNNYKDLSILRTNTNPISILLVEIPNVTFKCSYALTGYSIANLGKTFNINKLDYNYEKERRSIDKLSNDELLYNDNDVVIAGCGIIQKAIIRKEHTYELPLTFTSEMQKDKTKFIEENFGRKALQDIKRKRQGQLEFVDFDFYKLVYNTKHGGLTTNALECINRDMTNVFSIDFTSSYPDEMINSRFPKYTIKETFFFDSKKDDLLPTLFFNKFILDENNFYSNYKGFVSRVCIFDLKLKDKRIVPFLASSNCDIIKNAKTINGKVISCDEVVLNLCDTDFYILKKLYSFSKIICDKIYFTKKSEYLPFEEQCFILSKFIEKQKLKPFKDTTKKAQYNLSKVAINSQYGKKQQNPLKGVVSIENGNIIFTEFEFVGYKESGKTKKDWLNDSNFNLQRIAFENRKKDKNLQEIDIMTDGMYISAFAKRKLIEANIYLVNEFEKLKSNWELNVLYCDTDSLKFAINEKRSDPNTPLSNTPISLSEENNSSNIIVHYSKEEINKKVNEIIDKYNEQKLEKNKNNYRIQDFKNKFNIKDKELKEIYELGQFDIELEKDKEGNYLPIKYFKTLGAKKYCYIQPYYDKKDDKIKDELVTKIAGCSTKLSSYIKEYSEENKIDLITLVDKIFNIGSFFGKEISGRKVCYKEKRSHEEIEKIKYKDTKVTGFGGNMLENTSYTLGLTSNDYKYAFKTLGLDVEEINLVFDRDDKTGKLFILEDKKEIQKYLKENGDDVNEIL